MGSNLQADAPSNYIWISDSNPRLKGLTLEPSGLRLLLRFPLVIILHDYKKTRPSKIMKLLICRCHYLLDTLVEFRQNHIFLTLKMHERAIPVNVYKFLHKLLRIRALWRKNCQKSFRLLKSSTNPVTLPTCSSSKLANMSAEMQLCQI